MKCESMRGGLFRVSAKSRPAEKLPSVPERMTTRTERSRWSVCAVEINCWSRSIVSEFSLRGRFRRTWTRPGMDSEYSVVTSWSVPGELEVLGAVGVLLSVMLFNLNHVGRCGVRFGKPSGARGFAGDRQGKAVEKQNRRWDRFQITERRFLTT